MKKMKYLRTWLVVALVVTIIGSLTGGTVAWFTDNVTSAANEIQAGTLDVGMNVLVDGEWKDVESAEAPIFSYNLWEPGYTDLQKIQIVNNGNLAFKYQIKVVPSVTLSEGDVNLAEVIDVYYAVVDLGNGTETNYSEPESFAEIKANWTKIGTIADMAKVTETVKHGVMLDDQKTMTLAIALHMQESAGNEYQGKSVGDGFAVQVSAAQYMHEADAFGNINYDEDAVYGDDTPKALAIYLKPGDENYPSEGGKEIMYYVGEGPQRLDTAYVFSATESADEAAAGEYGAWLADFVVYANKDIPADSIALAGQYDNEWTGENWIGFANEGFAIDAGQKIRLLKDVTEGAICVNYTEVCNFKDFYCGAVAIDPAVLADTTLTVELRLYETKDPSETETGTQNEETGKSILISTFSYTF